MLSPDYWGGYLIYRLYPETPVVVDDRHDLYGEEFFRSYLKMMHVERGWDDFLETHEARACCCRETLRWRTFLAASKGWKSIYADDVAIAFVREGKKGTP